MRSAVSGFTLARPVFTPESKLMIAEVKPRALRVLVISHYFWPETSRLNDLVAGLAERGHQITVLTGVPNYPVGKYFDGYSAFGNLSEQYRGAEVIRVPVVPRARGRSWNLVVNYLSAAFAKSAAACSVVA